jgi:hypothetical protein
MAFTPVNPVTFSCTLVELPGNAVEWVIWAVCPVAMVEIYTNNTAAMANLRRVLVIIDFVKICAIW